MRHLRSLGFGASLRNLEPEADPSQPCVSPKSRLRSFIEETPKPESTPTATDYLRSLGFGASLRRAGAGTHPVRHSRSPKSRLRSFIEEWATRNAHGILWGSPKSRLRSFIEEWAHRHDRTTRARYLRSLGFGASLRNELDAGQHAAQLTISEVSASELH